MLHSRVSSWPYPQTRTRLEELVRGKRSILLRKGVTYDCKQFYNIGHWSLLYWYTFSCVNFFSQDTLQSGKEESLDILSHKFSKNDRRRGGWGEWKRESRATRRLEKICPINWNVAKTEAKTEAKILQPNLKVYNIYIEVLSNYSKPCFKNCLFRCNILKYSSKRWPNVQISTNLVLILPTFNEQLLRQNPFAKKLQTQIVST